MTVHGKVLLSQWLTREAGWRCGIMSTVSYEQQKLCMQTNNLIITREAGWCYGIMSTVSYAQKKIIQTNNLIITREAGLTPREPSISYDVYGTINI